MPATFRSAEFSDPKALTLFVRQAADAITSITAIVPTSSGTYQLFGMIDVAVLAGKDLSGLANHGDGRGYSLAGQ